MALPIKPHTAAPAEKPLRLGLDEIERARVSKGRGRKVGKGKSSFS